MVRQNTSRRDWLESVGLGALALAGGFSATAKGYYANETIRLGGIGVGGRFRHLMKSLPKLPGVQLVAVCDVWDDHLAQAKQLADPKVFVTKHFEELLERKDVDAVVIASPDHWHVPMTIAACQAKKDVYVEKPLTHDVGEGAAVIKAQDEHQRVVQVGMQQRSMPHFLKAREMVQAGQLGKIHKVHLTWNRNSPRARRQSYGINPKSVDWTRFLGNAPQQPFDEYRFRNWRWFWDFGGGILTDLMVHFIDVANWYCGVDQPASAVTVGDHFQAKGLWETPDTIQTLLRYPAAELQIYFEGTFFNARNGAMLEFMGTDGTLYLDRGRYEFHPEPGRKTPASEFVLGKGRRGADFYEQPDGEWLHLANWLECIRTRSKPRAPAEAGVAAVLGAHLGNRAYRAGQLARWDS